MSTDGLLRANRASRGKRMSKLLDDELEADDEFWNQEAFKEDAEDNEYEAEDEEADIFDSDFDEDEDEPDEDDVKEDERAPVKKRKRPPGHEKKKKEKKEGPVAREGRYLVKAASGADMSHPIMKVPEVSPHFHTQHQESGETLLDLDGERSVRKSTRTAVVIKQAEREAHQAALQALSKPVKKKKEEERKISQEDMLLEAAQTEIQNVQALEIMLAREEEVKRKAIIQKAVYTGPQVRFHSREGKNVLEFTKVDEFPEIFNSSAALNPKNVLCVITGQPAKYRDPKSNLPYATKEAFKLIRERFNKGENPVLKDQLEEPHQRKRTKVERERSGLGGRTTTKFKYNKLINMISDDVATLSHPAASSAFLKPMEHEVVSSQQSMEQTLQTPVDLGLSSLSERARNSISTLRKNLMSNEFSSLDMPGAFVEANEADFMLDDLEIPLPSNVDTELCPPTHISLSQLPETHSVADDLASNLVKKGSSGQSQKMFSVVMSELSDLHALSPCHRTS